METCDPLRIYFRWGNQFPFLNRNNDSWTEIHQGLAKTRALLSAIRYIIKHRKCVLDCNKFKGNMFRELLYVSGLNFRQRILKRETNSFRAVRNVCRSWRFFIFQRKRNLWYPQPCLIKRKSWKVLSWK